MADGGAEDGLTDEDRERLTQLLTNAMERGLLPEEEYLHRLGLVHAATSLDAATRVVQEMPVFTPTLAKPPKGRNRQKDASPPPPAAVPVADVGPPTALPSVADLALAAMPPPAPVDGSIAMTAPDPAAVMDAGRAEPVAAAPAGADTTRREPDPIDLLRMARPTPTRSASPGAGAAGADNRWKILVAVMIFFVALMIAGAFLVGKVHANNPSSTTSTTSMHAVQGSLHLHAAPGSLWRLTPS